MISEVVKNLKYVKLSKTNVDLSYFPDFMIVGPHRTGTTWIYKNLRRHPQIFMSRPKEIFYFNLLNEPCHPLYCSNDLRWYLKFFHDTPKSYLDSLIAYRELYNPKVRGEATASYAVMGKDLINEIVILNPKIKVILMIRNPLERAWSHIKYTLIKKTHRKLPDVPNIEFETFLRSDPQIANGHYTTMIDNWSSLLYDGNLFIGLFDDIKKSPQQLLMKIFSFLDVRKDPQYTKFAQRKINVTDSEPIPNRYREMFEDIFKDELEKLYTTYGLYWK